MKENKPLLILERTGRKRQLRLIKMRRQVLAKFSWLVDLVFREYDQREGYYLTCGVLSEKI